MTMKISIPSRGFKAASLGAAFALLALTGVAPIAAQARAPDQVHLNVSGTTMPTTKILAVGHWTPKATTAGVGRLFAFIWMGLSTNGSYSRITPALSSS
jgi:hypothetical protein